MKESDSFAYRVAYNLREPLMSVKGLLNLMRIDPERKNLDEYFRLMEMSVDQMSQSVQEIITHTEGESVKILLEEIDLKDVIEDAIQSHYFMRGIERISFILAINDVKFISDQKSLFTIFSNIISNVIRYHDPHKNSFLKISASSNHEDVEIIFEDNGMGMEESSYEKIFNGEEAHQGDHINMVKSSLKKLDSKLYIQSKPGEGTTFTVQIPLLFRKE